MPAGGPIGGPGFDGWGGPPGQPQGWPRFYVGVTWEEVMLIFLPGIGGDKSGGGLCPRCGLLLLPGASCPNCEKKKFATPRSLAVVFIVLISLIVLLAVLAWYF